MSKLLHMFSFHAIYLVTPELKNKDGSNYFLYFFDATVGQLVGMNMVGIKP